VVAQLQPITSKDSLPLIHPNALCLWWDHEDNSLESERWNGITWAQTHKFRQVRNFFSNFYPTISDFHLEKVREFSTTTSFSVSTREGKSKTKNINQIVSAREEKTFNGIRKLQLGH